MKLMKIIHTTVLLPALLGGCSLPHARTADGDAVHFVDTQIATHLRTIEMAQASLKQASVLTQPARAAPTGNIPANPTQKPADTSVQSPSALRNLARIKSLGTPDPFTYVSLHAKNQKLEPLLRRIVPVGWDITLSADLKAKVTKTISFDAGDQWPYVLDALLMREGWVALVEWPQKRVSIAYHTPAFSTSPVDAPAVTAKPIASGPRNPFSGKAQSPPSAAADKPATKPSAAPQSSPPPKVWRAEPGSTLKDSLFLWAAQEKCESGRNGSWSVAWLTDVNYRIDAPLQFTGSFKDALKDVFNLYASAAVPLYAGISTPQCMLKVDAREVR